MMIRKASRDASKLRKQPAIACYCKGEGGIQERRQNKKLNTGYTCGHGRSCDGSLLLCVHNSMYVLPQQVSHAFTGSCTCIFGRVP